MGKKDPGDTFSFIMVIEPSLLASIWCVSVGVIYTLVFKYPHWVTPKILFLLKIKTLFGRKHSQNANWNELNNCGLQFLSFWKNVCSFEVGY